MNLIISIAFALAGTLGTGDEQGVDTVWVHLLGFDGPLVPVTEGDLAIWSN